MVGPPEVFPRSVHARSDLQMVLTMQPGLQTSRRNSWLITPLQSTTWVPLCQSYIYKLLKTIISYPQKTNHLSLATEDTIMITIDIGWVKNEFQL